MKCDVCDSEATVFLTQIIDGKMTQVNLCDKCSKDQGVTDPTGFQLADFLIGAAPKKPKQAAPQDDDALACPSCGFTRAHLKKIGRMGCPDCYRVFADDLESMLRAMHKGTRHIGKAPVKEAVDSPEPSAEAAAKRESVTIGEGKEKEKKAKPSSLVAAPPVPPPTSPASLKRRLADLKAQIDKAVEDERYEDAAKLRDQVREIEAKLV